MELLNITDFVFYLFAGLTILSAVAVVFSQNPVHSVLFLIFAFFNVAGLFVLIGAEYIAMTLVIVYVGAVAVLFLFVVMMLNINVAELKDSLTKILPVGLVVSGVIMAQIILAYYASDQIKAQGVKVKDPVANYADVSNAHAIGELLYTDYIFVFQMSGLILLVAMISAIVLTLQNNVGVKRQDIVKQHGRKRKDTVKMVDIKPGEGI